IRRGSDGEGGHHGRDSRSDRVAGVSGFELHRRPRPGRRRRRDTLRGGVELRGFEPLTPCVQGRCSAGLSYSPVSVPVIVTPTPCRPRTGVSGYWLVLSSRGVVASRRLTTRSSRAVEGRAL